MIIKLSNRAAREFNEAADYLISENPSAAHMFADHIDQFYEHLQQNPYIGKPSAHRDWRVFSMTTFRFRIYYRINEETIVIETIFHTSQSPDKI